MPAAEGKPHSDHPLADVMGAIADLRELVKPVPGELRAIAHRMAKLEERQEVAERKAERAETVATGASRRVSELEGRQDDVTKAVQKHVSTLVASSAQVAETSRALVTSNEKQNLELAEQTRLLEGQKSALTKQRSILDSIRWWTPVIVAVATLLGTALGSGVSGYYHAKMMAQSLGAHGP